MSTRFFAFTSLALLMSVSVPLLAAEKLRVGVYENTPLVFMDQQGRAQGFVIDLLEQAAQKNDWQLDYQFAAWSHQLTALEQNRIDLLVGIAYSEERAQKYDFTSQAAINNWGVVLQASSLNLTSLQDLSERRIALMRKSIHSKAFIDTMANFGFEFEVVAVDDYQATFNAVHNGEADAAVVNRVFSLLHKDKHNLKETGIIFNPVEVRYAAPKGQFSDILMMLDEELERAKSDANSYYYHSMNKWFGTPRSQYNYTWLLWLVAFIVTLLVLVIFYNLMLSGQVRKRTRELASSEQRYRMAQTAAMVGTWEWDIKTNDVYWSDNIAALFGLRPENFDGTYDAYLNLLTPEDQLRVTRTVEAALQNKSEYQIEHKIIWPDGTTHWLAGRGKTFYDDSGQPLKMIGVVQDVTQKKQTETILRESEERFRQLAENINAVFWVGAVDWQTIHYISPAYETIWGFSCERLYQEPMSWFAAVHPDDRKQVEEDLRDKIDSKMAKPEFRVYRIIRPDGAVRWISARVYPILNQDGDVYRVAGIAEDVTKRYEAEAELEQHRNRLEEMVHARTLEYENINKELESFSYSVSHDLRAPLRAIDGFSEALREDYEHLLDATGKEYLERVRNAAQRMSILIDDLLHLSRVTRAELEKHRVNLSLLVQDVVTRHLENGQAAKFEYSIEPGLYVQADKRLLEIVINNLIDNAIKYSSKVANPKIEFGSLIKNDKRVYFVRDNGGGFDMRFVSKLFTPFQRLHNPSEYEGAGVGLATVKRIITRHGGEVWGESNDGQGAVFYFTL